MTKCLAVKIQERNLEKAEERNLKKIQGRDPERVLKNLLKENPDPEEKTFKS